MIIRPRHHHLPDAGEVRGTVASIAGTQTGRGADAYTHRCSSCQKAAFGLCTGRPPTKSSCLRRSMQKYIRPAYHALTGVNSLQLATPLHCGVTDSHASCLQQLQDILSMHLCTQTISATSQPHGQTSNIDSGHGQCVGTAGRRVRATQSASFGCL